MAADQTLSPVRSESVLRIPLVQGILERHSRPVDEPRDRHGALVHERQLSVLGHGARWHFCLARWARERRHFPRSARIPQGIFGQLFDQFWQRSAELHALYGQEGHARKYWRRGKPALPVG